MAYIHKLGRIDYIRSFYTQIITKILYMWKYLYYQQILVELRNLPRAITVRQSSPSELRVSGVSPIVVSSSTRVGGPLSIVFQTSQNNNCGQFLYILQSTSIDNIESFNLITIQLKKMRSRRRRISTCYALKASDTNYP